MLLPIRLSQISLTRTGITSIKQKTVLGSFSIIFRRFQSSFPALACLACQPFRRSNVPKELGVRKVMGASVPGLMQLMAKEFTVLVLIAVLIGCPAGWYAMNWWLNTYAYHVEVGTITLMAAAALCLIVSLLTVSYHAAKAAMVNPVKSLRYE